jgi:hypothetical protein
MGNFTVQKKADVEANELAVMEASVRNKRNMLLAECDWVVIRSQEVGDELSDEWKIYRQALRDIPSQSGFPSSVVWPDSPLS